uniref:EF-hand domain-containing protein n=1 Tax=Guillardia theta TaxID=55529 RepID=A0A7S4N8T1_GUITH|mmetsp:Transcript_18482/g.60668  ORF Transcript_18482/g.60668 Transcript_18482/m.60668 type:complete len:304 (-) Transcript_18482:40-951(-)
MMGGDDSGEGSTSKGDSTMIPGYTGHVHKLQETYGSTFAKAANLVTKCPPETPEPFSMWDLSKGTRTLQTSGYYVPGSGCAGSSRPSASTKDTNIFIQGSNVDLHQYYRTLEAGNYQQILIKSGSPKKARSFVQFGDGFYFSGPSFWETTYSESYDEESATKAVQNSDNKETASEEPEEVDAEEASLRYRVLQALVGTKRLDELELEIRDKVLQRMAGGAGQLLKSFKLFSSGKGEIGPNQLMSVCQDLGVDISRREATALFGRFDINKDGGIVYYEFVDALLQKDVSPGIKRNASYYDKRTK